MNEFPATDPALQGVDRSRIDAGWPILLAVTAWMIGLPLLARLTSSPPSATSTATLVGFAVIALLTAGLVLLRMPTDPVTLPFVGLAATVATLLALAPLDRPARADALIGFLLVAPWRYALTPLVVHFTLEMAWPHRRQRWAGWMFGWYAVQAGMFLVVIAGLVMGEPPLLDAIDRTFRATIVEPIGAVTAVVCAALALIAPVRGRVSRRALGWTLAAILVGLAPIVLSEFIPILDGPLDGAVTPARLALLGLPVFGIVAVMSLPFRDAAARDLLAHQLAAALLEGRDLSAPLRQIATALHAVFDTRGVAVRIAEPPTVVTVGEIAAPLPGGSMGTDIETGDERQELTAPIGRSANPLGEVRLEARFSGAFGPAERDWLTAFLQPIAAVLRARRRDIGSDERSDALIITLAETVAEVARETEQLPVPPGDGGTAVPPPVDAREVLGQLSDGVTAIARHGEGLSASAGDARDRARSASDSVAKALDALTTLSGEVGRLARHGDDIATSNDTVSGIAFRTNLVANNAALEATRAGAAGRTFGVLAEEVRRLADTTAATSAAIGQRTSALAAELGDIGALLEETRHALAAAIREAEAGESAAQRLSDSAVELEDTARSLRPAVAEANAVAKRRSARDQHLTATMERFLAERAGLARSLTQHRDAMSRLAQTLNRLTDGISRSR